MTLRSKYDPADHRGHDIYKAIFDEALTAILASPSEPNPTKLAMHVMGVLALDLEDLLQVEQLVRPALTAAKNPTTVASWRAVRAKEQGRR